MLHIDASRPDHLRARFSWPDDEPRGSMSVVGSFNDWTPGLDELTPDAAGRRRPDDEVRAEVGDVGLRTALLADAVHRRARADEPPSSPASPIERSSTSG